MNTKRFGLCCVVLLLLAAIGFRLSISSTMHRVIAENLSSQATKLSIAETPVVSPSVAKSTPLPQSSPLPVPNPLANFPAAFGLSGPVSLKDVPEGSFKSALVKLSPKARNFALGKLASLHVPINDVASLQADDTGHLYYQCPSPSETAGADLKEAQAALTALSAHSSGAESGSVPLASPPIRHSRPGSTKVLYLDFNGHTITGTVWNTAHGSVGDTDYRPAVASYVAKPFNTDGDATTFNDSEQATIIRVWERVAEDFLPFDVDVTTEQPATFAATTGRVLMTDSVDANGVSLPSSSTAAGVAFLDVFGDADYVSARSPAFVYVDKEYYYADYIAEAASHEAGHNLSLSHDGLLPNSTANEYYSGHGYGTTSWGPIMGTPYGRNVTQWSKGEYFSANNTQDDLAIIAGHLPYVGVAPVDNNSAAVSLGGLTGYGVIGTTGEADRYSISVGSPSIVTLTVSPLATLSDKTGGNASVDLKVYDAANALVSRDNGNYAPAASVSVPLVAGTYYLRISGVGFGTPLASYPTGYTSYGSLGGYLIVGSSAAGTAPNFTYQSSNQTISAGQSMNFQVYANGNPAPTYQWQRFAVGGSAWINLTDTGGYTGTSTNSMSLNVATVAMSGDQLRCVASNIAGSVTSTSAILTVNPAIAPGISAMVASQTLNYGDYISLYPNVTGTTPIVYQWKKDGVEILGANSSQYFKSSSTPTESGSYTLTATNYAGVATSTATVITVNPAVVPSISGLPASLTVEYGNQISLNPYVTGTQPITFQWKKDGIDIAGANSSSFSNYQAKVADHGVYTLVATNMVGSKTSLPVTVAVNALLLPVVTVQPVSVDVAKGASAGFSVTVTGSQPLSFQWYKDGQPIPSANYSGFNINSVSAADSGNYTVRITNDGGTVTSAAAELSVLPAQLPTFTSWYGLYPLSPSYPYLSIYPNVSSTTPMTFQWFKNGVAIAGATSSSYYNNAATASDAGIYTLQVTNEAGLAVSPDATVTWTSSANTPPWVDAVQQGNIAYFLATSPGRIMRYDLTAESWLPIVYLPEAKVPTAFLPTAEGVFIAYNTALVRRTLNLQTETPVATSGSTINSVFSFGNLLYFQDGSNVFTYDRSTLVAGPTFPGPYPYLYSGQLNRSTRPVISKSTSKGYISGFGYNSLIEFPIELDGTITSSTSSPDYYTFAIGSRDYLSPDESLVIDNSGVVYKSGDLTYSASLGRPFDDMIFLANGTPVALRGQTLTAHGGANFSETGRYQLGAMGYALFGKSNTTFVFGAPPSNTTNPTVSKVASSALVPVVATIPGSPANKVFSVEDAFIDSHAVIHLLSRSEQGMVRWDTKTKTFLSTIPLRGRPLFSSYAATIDRYAMVYGDGALTDFFPGTAAKEQNYGNISAQNMPLSLVALDDMTFLNVRQAGTSGDFRMVIGSVGEIKDYSNWSYWPRGQRWESSNRRLYSASAFNGNSMEYVAIPSTGLIAATPTTVANIVSPLRFSGDGTLVLSSNSRILNADLQQVGTLSNSVLDGVWLSDGLYTIRARPTGTELQKWARTSYTKTASLVLSGIPLRVFRVDDQNVAVVTLVNGFVSFCLIASNLSVTTSVTNIVTPEMTHALGDFNGDGKADLIWSNTSTGDRSMWLLNGNTVSAGASLGVVPVAWTISATADFDGDGKGDIFWTNTLTGDRAIWLMNGSSTKLNAFMGTVPPDWVISGTGDFNGDGKADIVWTNTATGDRAMWLLNGSNVLGGGYLGTIPAVWNISGVGDFNGDGKADLVWTNTSTGDRSMWLMNGSTMSAGATLGTVPVAWSISAVGDFNADGKADIFLTNTTTGDRVIWLMNGSTIVTNTFMGTVPVEWTVSGTGDFNGDGKKELFWTNSTTGDRAMWLLNGSTVTGGGFMGTVPVEWKINN